MPLSDDAKILGLIKAGNKDAFDDLIRKYQREIYFLALRMVKKPEDAEELTQQAFVKAFENLSRFRGDSGFKTWLYKVALNECRSHLRSRRQTLELNEAAGSLVSEQDTPVEAYLNRETAEEAVAAAENLSEKQRITVILRIYHEMNYAEIGKITGCSEQTAKVNFHYGIENLRKRMKENGTL